ncbi:MAG: protein kinase [Thermoanaerobaculia bacterium]|nr:protein kinase [Thermoanaerobaculia bacterium]
MSPEQIGRYVILRTLGRGAMGIVYLARDPQIERELALKTIRFDTAEKSFGADEAKARFLKEARISGRLQHPHIVTVFDVGEDQGTLYLAMELVQGGSFSQRLSDPAGFPMRERIRVVAEVAEALAHAHERGVLHRDVKPANILLSPTLSAKVTDFGIGKLLTGDTELTSTGQMVGSPAYMSPEQIKGEKLDARTDIFSLGIVLYQALTLRKPFPADTLTTLVYQILHEEPPDPSLVSSDVPEGMREIIGKCLAKDRANRYADAGELADDLREALGYSPVGSTAGFSESKVRRARPGSGTHPPVAPLAPPAGARASAALTAAVQALMPPIGESRPAGSSVENAVTSAPTVVSMPAVAGPSPDSESPTITTGRRMGEAVAKANAAEEAASKPAAPDRKKKGVSPLALGGGLLAALAVVLGMLVLSKKSEKEVGELPPVATPAPAASVPAPLPTLPPPAPKEPAATGPSTAGPSVAVVETPARDASPTLAPTKKARVKPTAAPSEAPVAVVPATPKPAQKPADLTVTVRRFLKIDVSPSQARVYLDGRYIGISDDWDDGGGGSLLAFNLEGAHRLRICAPEHRDLIVDLIVRSTATDDKVTIDRSLEKGTPDGPTGPAWLSEGKLKRPSYRTVRDAVFNVEPPEAFISVNGRVLGPASKDFQFAEMAVYEVLLTAPGYESKSLRILVGPTAGEVRANVKEKLKKM